MGSPNYAKLCNNSSKKSTVTVLSLLIGNCPITAKHLPKFVQEHTDRKWNLDILLHATTLTCQKYRENVAFNSELGVIAHACHVSTRRLKQEDCCEFKQSPERE